LIWLSRHARWHAQQSSSPIQQLERRAGLVVLTSVKEKVWVCCPCTKAVRLRVCGCGLGLRRVPGVRQFFLVSCVWPLERVLIALEHHWTAHARAY